MKTHTHTQGPWRIETWIYQNAREVVTIQTDKDAIATACNLWRDGDDSTFEVMANARLIAAAPDLLAALESLAIGLSPASVDMQRENLADLCRVCREIAESAISKVKGGNA
jgi:hypothetical protein